MYANENVLDSNQYDEDLERLERFQHAIKSHYFNGLPRHLSRPSQSIFKVLTEVKYLSLKPLEIQELLRNQCIVVTERTNEALQFNEAGLRTLAPLHKVVDVQGKSCAFSVLSTLGLQFLTGLGSRPFPERDR